MKHIFVATVTIFSLALAYLQADAIPRPEHPRPDFHREAWVNLNGSWNFAFDKENQGEELGWHNADHSDWPNKITVPYPWESSLSGVQNTEYKGTAWYQRTFTIPEEWEGRTILLKFGAVDWLAKVWVDGHLLGEHEGGYTPFKFEINDALSDDEEHTLTVKAVDHTDPSHPVGKQVHWYTTTSGIWQTVYLEAAGSNYIEDLDIVTDYNTNSVEIDAQVSGENRDGLRLKIESGQPLEAYRAVPNLGDSWLSEIGALSLRRQVQNARHWTPDEPSLYFIKVHLLKGDQVLDTVNTYFGIRDVSRARIGQEKYEYIHLNHKPFYIVSALNQSFHPDGIYTYPTDDLIREDVQRAKDWGYNNLRLHIKVDEPRFYYWCDRIGVTVFYDMPNTWRFNEEAQRTWELTMREAIDRDNNHPSVIAWVLFNETWGLDWNNPDCVPWVQEMFNIAQNLDGTRLVEDNSPNKRDHVVTDINSWHFYIYDHQRARDHIEEVVAKTFPGSKFNYVGGFSQGTEPLMNSEYGGISAGMGDRDISWCFHYLTNELRRHHKVGGYIYTELQDIEWEHNGFMNYDRSRKIFGYEDFVPVPSNHDLFSIQDLNKADYLVLDALAGQDLSEETGFAIQPTLSLMSGNYGGDSAQDMEYSLKWRLYSMDDYSQSGFDISGNYKTQWSFEKEGQSRIPAQTYQTNFGDPIGYRVKPGKLYLLYAWVETSFGSMVARNFWVTHSLSDGWLDYASRSKGTNFYWPANSADKTEGELIEIPNENRESISLAGKAKVHYKTSFSIPTGQKVRSAKLHLELAACAGTERVDWPQKIRAPSTPQTDVGNRFPSAVLVKVEGETVGEINLPNDPADYRGILSNIFEMAPPSSYGYYHAIDVPVEILNQMDIPRGSTVDELDITIESKPGTEGGVRIFGARTGRYPFPPTLSVEYETE